MDSFKIAVDKYVTAEPDSTWDVFYEMVEEKMSEEFWQKNENGFLMSNLYNKWMNKLFDRIEHFTFDEEGDPVDERRYLTHEQIAAIIERAANIYRISIR